LVKRTECYKLLSEKINDSTITVAAMPGTASEWYPFRGNYLNFGNIEMGLSATVAAGIACAQPKMRVISLESDGGLLFDLGILVTAAKMKLNNLIILVFDNESYWKFGPTATQGTNLLSDMGSAAGIKNSKTVRTIEEFEKALDETLKHWELSLIVVKIENVRGEATEIYRMKAGKGMKDDFVMSLRNYLRTHDQS
jgi:sulfopyruvate decarboxylase subunit beta